MPNRPVQFNPFPTRSSPRRTGYFESQYCNFNIFGNWDRLERINLEPRYNVGKEFENYTLKIGTRNSVTLKLFPPVKFLTNFPPIVRPR